MEKLKKVRTTDQSFANQAYPYAFLHFNRKLWDLQEFARNARADVTLAKLQEESVLSAERR